MSFQGTVFKKNITLLEESLIEGNCWALNCALFSHLSGDLHHGSAQYTIEGTRIALTKYSYDHKFKLFEDKTFGFILNRQLSELGYFIRSGDYRKDFEAIDDHLLKYLPDINKKYIKKEYNDILKREITSIPYALRKISCLYIVVKFLANVNNVMSRVEVDPIGTFMFDIMTDFGDYLEKKIASITPYSLVDYQTLFNEFLNQPKNRKNKRMLIDYQKAKIVSNFDIEMFLEMGESDEIEFKEKETDSIAKSVIAFSNTWGGKIFVGISDQKRVIGVKDIDKTIDKISNIIASTCRPSIYPRILTQKFRRKNIIILDVSISKNIVSDNENRVYVRRNKQCVIPPPSEMEDIRKFKEKLLSK